MGITGDWDQRITRRTLLEDGRIVRGVGDRHRRARDAGRSRRPPSPRTRSRWASRRATRRPTASCCGRGWRPSPRPGGGMGHEVFGVRYEVAEDEGFRDIVRRGAVEAMPDEAHSVRVELEDLEPAHEYFYRFKFGPEVSPQRPHADRARARPQARAARVRLRVVPELPRRLLHALRRRSRTSDDDPRRRAPRRLHLRGPVADLPQARAAARDLLARRLPDPARPVQDRRAPAGGARGASVAGHLGRPRVQEQLRRPGLRPRRAARGGDRPPRGRLPGLLGAHAAAPLAQAGRARPSSSTAASTGATSSPSTCSTGASTAPTSRPRARPRSGRRAATARRRSSPGAPCSAPSSATGCSRSSPPRPRAGTCSPSRRRSRRSTTTRARCAASGRATTGTATSPSGRCCSTGWSRKRTPNPIVITGDSHNNWVRNVPPDHINFDAPPVATEFMGTSISTGGDQAPFVRVPAPQNPHILLRNNNRGYVRCTLTPDTWTSEFRKRRHGAPARVPVHARSRRSPWRTGWPARSGSPQRQPDRRRRAVSLRDLARDLGLVVGQARPLRGELGAEEQHHRGGVDEQQQRHQRAERAVERAEVGEVLEVELEALAQQREQQHGDDDARPDVLRALALHRQHAVEEQDHRAREDEREHVADEVQQRGDRARRPPRRRAARPPCGWR